MYIVCIYSGYPEMSTVSIYFNSFIRETYNSNTGPSLKDLKNL